MALLVFTKYKKEREKCCFKKERKKEKRFFLLELLDGNREEEREFRISGLFFFFQGHHACGTRKEKNKFHWKIRVLYGVEQGAKIDHSTQQQQQRHGSYNKSQKTFAAEAGSRLFALDRQNTFLPSLTTTESPNILFFQMTNLWNWQTLTFHRFYPQKFFDFSWKREIV